jgi:hypothetical protein
MSSMIDSNVVRGLGNSVLKISEKYLVRPPQIDNVGRGGYGFKIRSKIIGPRGGRGNGGRCRVVRDI